METANDSVPQPVFIHLRLVHLYRWKKISPSRYGFSITKDRESSLTHSITHGLTSSLPIRKERDHRITTVAPGTPAYFSGLREMDHLISVDGHPVSKKSQKIVGQMIREKQDEILLFVCDDETFKHFKSSGMSFEPVSKDYPVLFISGSPEPSILENADWKRKQGVNISRRFSLEVSPILRKKTKSALYTVN